MTTITAAVAREHHAPLSLEELELDEIRDNEVRVRMVATGICHTDAVVRDGLAPDTPARRPGSRGHRARRGGGQVDHHCPSRRPRGARRRLLRHLQAVPSRAHGLLRERVG